VLNGRQQFGLALSAALAGLAWGYLRHRADRRAMWFALVQGAEWFVAYGGATIVLQTLRESLDRSAQQPIDDFEVERITRTRQIVSERTGTEG
jgi:hypothetical protein